MILRRALAAFAFLAALAAHALSVATYNVENYLVADRMVEGVFRKEYPKPEAEKRALRQAIKAMAPDILAVQEMGRAPFLEELQRDLKAEGLDYPHAVVLEAADPDRHVAVLSKLPFKGVREHARIPVKYLGQSDVVKRGLLEATFATREGDLTVFVVHLKSRRTERPDDPEGAAQRAAEAEAVRDAVLERFPDPAGGRFIVCGDWNDTRNSKPVRTLAKRGGTVVGEILRAYDSRGETWTHAYRREDTYSRIDYLMVSPGLKPFVRNKGNARIHDGPGVRDASDHRPVYAQFDLTPVP
ncbi:MAG: endonuclease/exonuclease/phosphatase family protein [Opitutus sp.]|nr:endonuclease/exonuclease/phosphatase family protein [Opitutus sp.]